MAFCRYCGASLAEGQTCTCPQAQAEAQAASVQPAAPVQPTPVQQPAAPQQPAPQQPAPQQPVYAQQPVYNQQPVYAQQPAQPSAAQQQAAAAQAAAVDAAKNVKSYLGEYFADAGKAVRTVVEQDNTRFAVILTVIRALAMGLAVYGLLHKICSIALTTAMSAMGGFGSYAGMLGTSIKAPLVGSLLYGALMALAGMALFVVMVFVLSKLTGGSVGVKAVYQASAANGVLTTAILLLAFLLSFVNVTAGVVFLLLACLSWMVSGVLTAQLVCADNRSGKFWLLYFVGVVLVFWLGNMVLSNLFLGAVGGISVTASGETHTLKEAIDMFKLQLAQMGGWSGVIQEMIGDIF